MKKVRLIKNVLFITVFFCAVTVLQSCESDSSTIETRKTNTTDFQLKSGEPVLNFRLTSESDLIGATDGCYDFQIRFYAIFDNGEKILLHSAIMRSCIEKEAQGNSEECEGPFKGDLIVEDYKINGCIKDFMETETDAYDLYVIEREEIIRNN